MNDHWPRNLSQRPNTEPEISVKANPAETRQVALPGGRSSKLRPRNIQRDAMHNSKSIAIFYSPSSPAAPPAEAAIYFLFIRGGVGNCPVRSF